MVKARAAILRRHAAEFQLADRDGHGELSFEQFRDHLLPKVVLETLSEATVRSWFTAMDAHNTGRVNVAAYFIWSVGAADQLASRYAADGFSRFDSDKSGRLDEIEFARAVEDMGYGDYARDLCIALDPNTLYI
jgi:Ca2+-binding EF-hand superfamily protein